MIVPAIARKTFNELKLNPDYVNIVHDVIDRLKKLSEANERAHLVHDLVDEYNKEVFSHPLVQQYSPCQKGCTACCHTQVSVTEDEASLLVKRIQEGTTIKEDLLLIQMAAGNDDKDYLNIPYHQRKCIFLDEEGGCRVYEDRPSVCRTNAVIGTPDQCDTSVEIQPTRLIKTPKSDMVIYGSFHFSKESGTLPYMVGKLLGYLKIIE